MFRFWPRDPPDANEYHQSSLIYGHFSPRQGLRFCRNYSLRLKAGPRWTQLCCEGRKLRERRHARLIELSLADHMRGFDTSQCRGG